MLMYRDGFKFTNVSFLDIPYLTFPSEPLHVSDIADTFSTVCYKYPSSDEFVLELIKS
jgi:hypothetical protein